MENTNQNAEKSSIPKIEISKNKARSGRKSIGKTKSKLNQKSFTLPEDINTPNIEIVNLNDE